MPNPIKKTITKIGKNIAASYIHGNASKNLEKLIKEKRKFKLIITSPSYNMDKEYEKSQSLENYKEEIKSVIKNLVKLLQKNGSICYKTLMIDCFPKEEQLSKNKIRQRFLPKQEMKFCIFDDLTHTQYWEVFQRILRVTEMPLLDDRIRNFLLQITPLEFVEQRNNLHYVSNYWLITQDLFERIFDNNFGVRENLIKLLDEGINNSDLDFSILVCYLLLKLNIDLIKSLSELSEEIGNEYDLIIKTLNEGIHDRFHSSISLN